MPLVVLGLLLTACSPSIQEKKEEFGKTLAALTKQGFTLQKQSDEREKSLYLLKLDRSEAVASFLLRSVTGSSDPELTKRLARTMKGLRLELEVDWPRYAKGEPKSVVAYLLPGEGNVTGEWARLLREKKIAADLDFGKKGKLKRVTMHPLDEMLKKKDKTGRLQLKDTFLEIDRSGKESFDQAYRLHSALLQLTMETAKGDELALGYRNLQCVVDTQDAYFGTRECMLASVTMEMLEQGSAGSDKTKIAVEKLEAKNSAAKEGSEVVSHGRLGIAKILVTEESPRTKGMTTLEGIELTGHGNGIDEGVYRRLVDLLANPPADQKIYGAKLLEILSDLFRKLRLGYTLKIDKITGSVAMPRRQETTRFDLQGMELGVDWSLADDLNISKGLTLASARMSRKRRGEVEREGAIRNLALKIRIDKLYNFMPRLMKLAATQARHPSQTPDPQVRKALAELGAEVLHRGAELSIDPLSFDSLTLRNAKESKSFDAVSLRLRSELIPNRLDPANPLAPMMALAYLKADGELTLSKKDLEQLLPLLDPAMGMMVASFVRYEGNQARFTLRFEQGNLLINGKPLR